MELQTTRKTALVTGPTAGIGLAIARRLAAEEAVTGRTAAAKATTLAEGPRAMVRGGAVNFGDVARVRLLLAAVLAVDILVANVGIFEPKPFAEITDADWLGPFEVNVLSGVQLARHYFAPILARNWGRILFISNESSLQIPQEIIH